MEHTYIRWDSIEENNFTCYTEKDGGNEITYHIPTANPVFSIIVKKLKDARTENVTKENNYILFIRWSSLDSSCGLRGTTKPANKQKHQRGQKRKQIES